MNVMPPTNRHLHVSMTILHTTIPPTTGSLNIFLTTPHGPLQEGIQISTITPQILIIIPIITHHIVSPLLLLHPICVGRTLTSPLVVKLNAAPLTDASGTIMKTSTPPTCGRKTTKVNLSRGEVEIFLAEIKDLLRKRPHCME